VVTYPVQGAGISQDYQEKLPSSIVYFRTAGVMCRRISPIELPYRSLDRQKGKTIPFTNQFKILKDSYREEFCKKEKNYEISTGVSGVSGDSLCNRPACPQLA